MKKSAALCGVFMLFSMAFISCNQGKGLKKQNLTITRSDKSTITVNAEIAVTEEEKSFGFMERKNIPDGTGMLFVYDHDLLMSFWMKNTPHPLSIAFIDCTGKIRELHNMKPFSLDSVSSQAYCRYALEVPQGWFKDNNINPGDYIDLSVIK